MLVIWILMGAFVVWGIFLMNGKGTFLISGYNTMSEEKKSQYDDLAVAKFMSKIAFSIAFSMVFWVLGDIYDSNGLLVFGTVLTVAIVLFFLIYANKSETLRKK